MQTFNQRAKESLILSVFNILLPTTDMYSDLYFIGWLYINTPYHYKCKWPHHYPCKWSWNEYRLNSQLFTWAGLLLGPFLFNYTLCWIAWFRMDKQKRKTWIAPLFGCYPQLIAVRIIWLFWANPVEGMRQKRHLERNSMENEIFAEAVPSALAMTFLMIRNLNAGRKSLIIGEEGSLESTLFFVTFSTSVITAGLGLAKCLKVGLIMH